MSGAEEYRVVTSDVVNIGVTSNVNSFQSIKRFNKDLTIANFKGKLELIAGASAASMVLELYSKEDTLLCKLDNDDALLGSYPIDDDCRVHVIDKAGKLGEFEDVSKVEKFELSTEEYNKRGDSVRAFKEKMKLGRFREKDPEEEMRIEKENQAKEEEEKALAESIKVGDRCETKTPGQMTRRGEVMYSGLTDFKPGYWIGVKYDEPVGKNDGSVSGKRYFECQPKYGGFVKPKNIDVGDFPEFGLDDDDDMEM